MDRETLSRLKSATEVNAPGQVGHLACRARVRNSVEKGDRDICMATHASSNMTTVGRKGRAVLVHGRHVAWYPQSRLRVGELELWPELVEQVARLLLTTTY